MWKCGSNLFGFRKRFQPRNLDYIDKSHCSLTEVPDEVLRHERTLEELLLDANQLADLPKGIFRMQKLKRLILNDNEIADLPTELGNLSALEELDVSKNDFREIPESIEKLKKLTYLDISNNTLGELPDSITKLPELENFVVNDIALGEIPPEIGSLSNLVILELRDNCIKFLPLSFSFLSNLKRLDLGGNELEELPDTIGQLSSLVELWLDTNFLSTLPAEIGELKTLECLDVSENRIEELPEEIGGLESLTDLIVSANVLHELPEGLGQLHNLQILKADQNEIDDLTECIGGCTSLLELILTENVIEFFPGSLGKLTKLSHINVDKNRLFTFPPEIGNCVQLSVLSARDNQISKIPKEIGNCRSLTVLALSGNKLESLPLSVSSLPLKALWLSQNQSQSVLKLQVEDDPNSNEKVLTCFLFPQEALKSSSIENFINDVYDNEGDTKPWQSYTPSAVHFNNESDALRESNLQRQDTPYPKDLRHRHPHLIRKRSGSGESDRSIEHVRLSTDITNMKMSPQKEGLRIDESAVLIDRDDIGMENRVVGFDNPVIVNGVDNSAAALASNESDEAEKSSSEAESTSEDEDDDGIKRVGFAVPDDSPKSNIPDRFSDDDVCRLHRKDTPHFLKGKRITETTDDNKLKDILSKIEERKSSLDMMIEEPADEESGKIFENPQVIKEDDPTEESFLVVEDVHNNEDVETDEKKTAPPKYKRRDTPRPAEFEKKQFSPRSDVSHIFAEEEEEEDKEEEDSESFVEIEDEQTVTKVYEEITTTITRTDQSLGINIAGGLGTTTFQEDEELASGSTVRQFEDQGVFITKIADSGPAAQTGVLRVGDKIIKVHDRDISEFSHNNAVQVLREAGDNVTLVVLREVTDEDQINIALQQREEKNVRFAAEPEVENIEIAAETIPVMLKRDGKGLGFSIAGGKGSTPYQGKNDESIYISKLSENGPAALDKRLEVGDRILSINSVDVRTAKHEDVVKILTSCTDKVTLVAYRERIINKKMIPLSQINGTVNGQIKTVGESTKADDIPSDSRTEEPRLLVEEIVLEKAAGPLGLSIVGGSDHASHPFGVNEPGVFVSKVNPTGEAAKTNLCVGDRILRVNDQDMQKATHHEAVAALVSDDPEIKLLVRHDPPPPGIQEINIVKKLGEKLGISIRGGAQGHPGNPFDKRDEGIFVSKVNPAGAAARDGTLKIGMRILEVNGTSLLGATHVDAVRALRTAGDNISMIVCDGYDASQVTEDAEENILFNPALCDVSRFSPESQSANVSIDSTNGTNTKLFYDEKTAPTATLSQQSEDETTTHISNNGNKV